MATLKRKRTASDFGRSLTDEIVEIHCGNPPVKYKVYKAMLSAASSYFKAAFEGSFSEGAERILQLEDEDPKIFVIVLQSVYYEEVKHEVALNDAAAADVLIKLYIAFDQYDMLPLSCSALQSLRNFYINLKRPPSNDSIALVYESRTESSPLRKCIVRMAARCCLSSRKLLEGYDDMVHCFPEFAVDLSQVLSRAASKSFDNKSSDNASNGNGFEAAFTKHSPTEATESFTSFSSGEFSAGRLFRPFESSPA